MKHTQLYYLTTMGIDTFQRRQPRPALHVVATTDWDNLQTTVAHCQQCSLHQTRTQTVFGTGNRQAALMIIGEAPGFYEDQQGKPFVGRAGQLLTTMLQAIGLSREAVYIANILKCRPPNNRDPLPEEVQSCTIYLERQIALIQPKLILAVGKVAAHYLLQQKSTLEAMRGKTYSFGKLNTPLLVTFHPAYLLRNPQDKKKAFVDLQLVCKQLGNSND